MKKRLWWKKKCNWYHNGATVECSASPRGWWNGVSRGDLSSKRHILLDMQIFKATLQHLGLKCKSISIAWALVSVLENCTCGKLHPKEKGSSNLMNSFLIFVPLDMKERQPRTPQISSEIINLLETACEMCLSLNVQTICVKIKFTVISPFCKVVSPTLRSPCLAAVPSTTVWSLACGLFSPSQPFNKKFLHFILGFNFQESPDLDTTL